MHTCFGWLYIVNGHDGGAHISIGLATTFARWAVADIDHKYKCHSRPAGVLDSPYQRRAFGCLAEQPVYRPIFWVSEHLVTWKTRRASCGRQNGTQWVGGLAVVLKQFVDIDRKLWLVVLSSCFTYICRDRAWCGCGSMRVLYPVGGHSPFLQGTTQSVVSADGSQISF